MRGKNSTDSCILVCGDGKVGPLGLWMPQNPCEASGVEGQWLYVFMA